MHDRTDANPKELLARIQWVRTLAAALIRDTDKAEDIAQEAWLRQIEKPPRDSTAWRGWFARVMKNLVNESGRSQARRTELLGQRLAEKTVSSPAEIALRLETQQVLIESLRALPEPFQSTTSLRYLEGWSPQKIARHEGVPTRAVETRLRRAMVMLRKEIAKRGQVERWAVGLMLLATRSTVVPLLMAAAAATVLLSVSAIWLIGSPGHPASDASVNGPRRFAAGPEIAGAELRTGLLPVPAVAAHLGREAVLPVAPTLIQIVDAVTRAPVTAMRVSMEFVDLEGGILGTADWISTSTPAEVQIPSGARRIRYRIDPSATHARSNQESSVELGSSTNHPTQIQLVVMPLQGEMRGRVQDPEGTPLAGVEVGVWIGDSPRHGTQPSRTVLTAEDGSFSVEPIKADRIETYLAPLGAGHSAARGFTLNRNLAQGQIVDGIELVLEPGRVFQVLVQDEGGGPVADASVRLKPARSLEHLPQHSVGIHTDAARYFLRTDAEGAVPPVRLANEDCLVEITREGYMPWSGTISVHESLLIARLTPPAWVHGVVRNSEGRPVPGARVLLHSGSLETEVCSGLDGRFNALHPNTPAGDLEVIVHPPPPWAMSFVGPLAEADRSVEILCLVEVGEALSVELVQADGEPWPEEWDARAAVRGGSLPVGSSVQVEESGAFVPGAQAVWTGLPHDSYLITFQDDRGVPLAEAVLVSGGPTARLPVGTFPGERATLTGTVRDAASGEPIQRFHVSCRPLGVLDTLGQPSDAISVSVDSSDGAFHIPGLQPGTWQVTVADDEYHSDWGVESVALAGGTQVTLAPALDEAFGGLLTVLDAMGDPVKDATIHLLGPEGNAPLLVTGGFSGVTDAEGKVSLLRLPRSLPLQIEATLADGRRWSFASGTLDPALSEWQIVLQ
jgi:RNA polymerase sigma-70 factor (ECF subfamily)